MTTETPSHLLSGSVQNGSDWEMIVGALGVGYVHPDGGSIAKAGATEIIEATSEKSNAESIFFILLTYSP